MPAPEIVRFQSATVWFSGERVAVLDRPHYNYRVTCYARRGDYASDYRRAHGDQRTTHASYSAAYSTAQAWAPV